MNIVKLALREWSFQAFNVVYIIGSVFMLVSTSNSTINTNGIPVGFSRYLLIFLIILFVDVGLLTYAIYKVRLKFTDNYTGKFTGFISANYRHGMKSMIVLLPFMIIMLIILMNSMDTRIQAQDPKRLSLVWVAISPLYLLFVIWIMAGFSIVIAQLSSKKSIRNSFRVVIKRFKPLLSLAMVYVILLIFMNIYSGYMDENISQNQMPTLNIYTKILMIMVYLFLILLSFFGNLYIAEGLIGTDLIENN